MTKYSKEEEKKLRELNNQGLGPKEISEYFPKRTYSGVKDKLKSMRLLLKETNLPTTNELESKVLRAIKGKTHTILALSNKFDISPNKAREYVTGLKSKGYNILIDDDAVEIPRDREVASHTRILDVKDFYSDKDQTDVYVFDPQTKKEILVGKGLVFKIGAVSDTHLGSKFERLDELENFYDQCKKEGVKVVLHGGNYIDGEARFNKFDVKVKGFDEQIDYFLKHYPRRDGIQTWFIDGDDHEGWYFQREGLEPGRVVMERQKNYGRSDLVYLGYQEANIVLKNKKGRSLIKLLHGGGGTAYADSYRTQKIVEALQEGEKPDILLVGHYHKAIYHTPRGVHSVLMGCFQDQTRFMRKKEIKAYVGGWIIEWRGCPSHPNR